MDTSLIRHQTQTLLRSLKENNDYQDDNSPKENRVTVKCDKILKLKADVWLRDPTSNAHELGFYSIGDIVSTALREFLENYMTTPEVPSHFILPNTEHHEMTLDFDVYEEKIICNMCDSETCIHIKKLQTDKIAKKYLQEHYQKRKQRRD